MTAWLVRHGGAYKEEELQDLDYSEVAELFKQAAGNNYYIKHLRSTLGPNAVQPHDPALDPILANAVRLLNLLWPVPGILAVTTNFDSVLEDRLARDHAKVVRRVITRDDLATMNAKGELTLLKIHGDIDVPDSLILSLRDYGEFRIKKQHFLSILADIFTQKTVLFVGYSLKDPNFRALIAEIRAVSGNFARRHFLVAHDENAARRRAYEELGITTLTAPTGPEVREVFDAIIDSAHGALVPRDDVRELPDAIQRKIANCRILVVDDEQGVRYGVEHILRRYGVSRVDTAVDGAEALKLLKRSRYDAVLLDLEMPMFSGEEGISVTRSGGKNADTIIVVITGFCDRGPEAVVRGADAVIIKPFGPSGFMRIFQLLRIKKGWYSPPKKALEITDHSASAGATVERQEPRRRTRKSQL